MLDISSVRSYTLLITVMYTRTNNSIFAFHRAIFDLVIEDRGVQAGETGIEKIISGTPQTSRVVLLVIGLDGFDTCPESYKWLRGCVNLFPSSFQFRLPVFPSTPTSHDIPPLSHKGAASIRGASPVICGPKVIFS